MGKTDGRSSVARAITKATKALNSEREKSKKLAELASDALSVACLLEQLAQAEHELRKSDAAATSDIVAAQRVEAGGKLANLLKSRKSLTLEKALGLA